MKEKTYNMEDRLVEFCGDIIIFNKSLPTDETGKYFSNQLLRSSGSAALHYGEAQGTDTIKDFIHTMSQVVKELKETRVSLKILSYVTYGDEDQQTVLVQEVTS